MKLVIINYGAGNIKSLQFAFKRLGVEAILSDDTETIKKADKVIFPGVGEASSAMKKLKETGLHKLIPTLKQPVLGICLGMQLMCNYTEEGQTEGLGIFDVDVLKFDSTLVKVPQIGWNTITNLKSELFQQVSEHSFMYLVHSYYAPISTETISTSEYQIQYSSALQKDNFYGVQFHPEKSSNDGEQLLKNFLNL
ncbi:MULTISPECIES: imidazole glycerol phosphate synthase subunit HisH [Croceibacter]|jgi:glutamine amidotransferase|uniref:imidazole glycerol phosphate synthase subunit HisH n=1 Tax=Croceibacter TaxID=216431 RepID=UPI000C3852D8|nr:MULTISPECIES: imidazole glycerol phosphate synthase subunit HisH [Croceibacter]MAM22522.1 imidazole glycerol phosphate synthase subunit HisH [Croceibacter sp.]MBG24754.1 imidazole glycerol phosphate synthase subunit HisH [Croceibacter sp.]WSP33834.1 imidazole glycerol phosphate synthase subunit HisH [Croceibacter atlanticus]|tara:strand:- start:2090 stop:2674 length:585 start_codon:yes stop_codon:yes gene_type:complete